MNNLKNLTTQSNIKKDIWTTPKIKYFLKRNKWTNNAIRDCITFIFIFVFVFSCVLWRRGRSHSFEQGLEVRGGGRASQWGRDTQNLTGGVVTKLVDSTKAWLPGFEFPFHYLLPEWSPPGRSLGLLSFLIFKTERTLDPLQRPPGTSCSGAGMRARKGVRLTSTNRCHSYSLT